MRFFKVIIPFVTCMAIICMQALNANAQKAERIKLVDKTTSSPIVGASFQYGSFTGVSDEEGMIEFTPTDEKSISFSHLNYGTWQLNEIELQQAIKSGVVYRKQQSVDMYPVTVIALKPTQSPSDKLEIDYQDRMAHDGAAILEQIPSISSVRKGGNYGADPVLRGFKNDQLNIVLNCAQCATAACPNRMDPPTSQMAPNMIDRIEILKGPYALRYGAGFGGTINFIPAPLRFEEHPEVYGRLSGGYENNGSVKRSEGLVGMSGKNYDLGLFASWSEGNDYESGNNHSIQADFLRASFGINLGLKLAEYHEMRISTNHNIARDADFPALPMDLREDNTWMFNIQHEMVFDAEYLDTWTTTVYGSFVDHLMDNRLKTLNPRMLNAETDANTYNYGARTETYWDLDNGPFYAGADFRVEGADGTRTRDYLMGMQAGKTFEDNVWQDSRIIKTGLFAEYQYKSAYTNVIVSGRVDLVSAESNDPSAEFLTAYSKTSETQINPSLSLGITRHLNYEVSLSLWLGRVQRSGGLVERFINYFPVGQDPYELVGNPTLNPEINNQIDFSLRWIRGETALNVDIFASYLQDFISSSIDTSLTPRLPMSPGVRRFTNIGKAYKLGFEFNWKQNLFSGLHHRLGIAYTYAQDLERKEPLPEIAPLDIRYTIFGNFLEDKLQPEFTFRHVLKQTRVSSEYGESKTPGFSILDLKLSYQLLETFRVSAGINNVFDTNYYEHLSRSVRGTTDPIYSPGRNFYTSFNIGF